MSKTLAQTEIAVRFLLNDTDLSNAAIDSRRLRQLITARGESIGAGLGYGREWITTICTLSDTGSNDFSISGISTFELDRLMILRLHSNGQPIQIVSEEQMENLRSYLTDSTGTPIAATLIEGKGPTYLIRFYPRPTVSDTVDGLLSRSIGTDLADSTVMFFSALILRGVEHMAAGDAYTLMKPADRERIGLDDKSLQTFREVAASCVSEGKRQNAAFARGPMGLTLNRW